MCGIWALLSKQKIQNFGVLYSAFMQLKHRGPDFSSFELLTDNLLLGFHRLAIMDLSIKGNQPFSYIRPDGTSIYCICNGEIYDYKKIKQDYNIETISESDCEIIIPLYEKVGIEKTVELLGSEFAFIIVEISKNKKVKIVCGRDPLGVRPLFYGIDNNSICFSSELKGLSDCFEKVYVFPPGNYMIYEDSVLKLIPYHDHLYQIKSNKVESKREIMGNIRRLFIESVRKRLDTNRQFGCLLSGGLDSSLVCGVVKYILNESFPVFTIALKSGGTDLPYAKKVVEYLGLEHHVIMIDETEALDAIKIVIEKIESWDVTTVRASTMQYLIGKYIKENTDVRVLGVGEASDELLQGYKYFHKQPNMKEGRDDSIRLVKDIHRFDGLRADRAMSCHSLEIRLPFADVDFVNYVMRIDPKYIKPENNFEKTILRDAFKDMKLIPEDVLYRNKEALSDACSGVERSWFEIIQEWVEGNVSDEEYQNSEFEFGPKIFSKESLYYRKVFEDRFGKSKEKIELIPYYWMPRWVGSGVCDPSARTLD